MSTVTSVTFSVQAGDRVAYRHNVEATFTFTPSGYGLLSGTPLVRVTLNYPSGFFDTSVTPTASVSVGYSESMTTENPGETSIVLAVGEDHWPSYEGITDSVTVTLRGCKLGIARAATDSVTVQTNTDPGASSPAVSCGVIISKVQNAVLELAAADKKAFQATTATTTVTFTTQTAIATSGIIIISLPSGYFSGGANPTGVLALQPSLGTATLSGCALTAGAPLTIVCTTANATLAAGQSRITFAAGQLTTGNENGGSSTGLTVTTSEDTVSAGAAVPALIIVWCGT
jgi:hypothetical protein